MKDMSWKRRAEEDLRSYNRCRSAVKKIEAEIKRIDEELTGIRVPAYSQDVVRGGAGRREDVVIRLIMEKERYELAIKEKKIFCAKVLMGLSELSDEQRLIIEYVDFGAGNILDLPEALHIELSSIYRRRTDALKAYARAVGYIV